MVRTMAIGNLVCDFFLKSIDCWSIVETGWTKPTDATLKLVTEKNAQLSIDKALHALCQALSPSKFARISNSESAKKRWKILETTYEGTKLVKSAKLQILISKFEEIKMLEDEIFGELKSVRTVLPFRPDGCYFPIRV